jgi:hypothetical protein
MAVKKIEFEDKVSTIESSLPAVNRIRDVDINEIKDVVNNNADEQAKSGIKLYNVAPDMSEVSTGSISLVDDVDNYIAFIVLTGYISGGNIDQHIIVPWLSQISTNGTFSGWRIGSDNKEITIQRGSGKIVSYFSNQRTWVIESNSTGYNIRAIYGIKVV